MEKVNRTLENTANRFSAQYYVVNTVTIIGIFVSIVFICVHLVVHLLANNLHNLQGRNLASFCVSLLMEYSCILLSTVVEDYFCWLISGLVNYFVMSSYMWMLMMSYDTWRTIRNSIRECTLSCGDKWKRFYVYAGCSWLIPFLYLVLLDCIIPKFNMDYRIELNEMGCPVSEPLLTLLKKYTLLLILLSNSFFFGSSLYYIYINIHFTRTLNIDDNNFVNHFSLHMRLILITGLTWTAEELAFYSSLDVLSLTFQTINMFEGLFIALAFTCRKQVLNSIKFLKCV
ncbi:hypothetical protein PGB90_007618 [Kerria lacca]